MVFFLLAFPSSGFGHSWIPDPEMRDMQSMTLSRVVDGSVLCSYYRPLTVGPNPGIQSGQGSESWVRCKSSNSMGLALEPRENP